MSEFENKVLAFLVNIKNSYKEEDDREQISRLEFESESMTEDFTALLFAVFIFYKQVTKDEGMDFIGFTHVANRLAVQDLMKEDGGNINE